MRRRSLSSLRLEHDTDERETCRLWQNDGIALYLRLLTDAFWVNPALEAILVWCVPVSLPLPPFSVDTS